MKYNIFKGLLVCGTFLTLAGCSENSWNKDYLDGFEVPPVNSTVSSVEYTLTSADYKTLAGLSSAKALAKESGDSAILAKVGNNGYFIGGVSAQKYAPLFMASSSFPYFVANNGSTVSLTYQEQVELPEICNSVYNAKVYTLNNDDYQIVWNGPTYTDAFAPSMIPAAYMGKILAQAYPSAEAGQYALVNYNVAGEEPKFQPVEITPVKDVKKGAGVTLDGYVTAICAQGYILSDETGSILVYHGKNFDASKYLIGMRMQVAGAGSSYNGGLQLSPESGKENNIAATSGYSYPAPEVLTAESFDTYAQTFATANTESAGLLAKYVEATVEFTSVGNYVNFSLPGATIAGSAYQATDALKEMLEKGKTAKICGYVMSANINRDTKAPTYLNFIITSVDGNKVYANAEEQPYVPAPIPVDNYAANGLYSFDGSKWSVSEETYVVSPTELVEMGYSPTLSNTDAARVLPIFLKQTFPYATAGTSKFLSYQSGKKYANCKEFVYDGNEWIENTGVEVKTGQFAKVNGKWMFNPNITISIPAVRNSDEGKLFYKPIVDWVRDNQGAGYIDSYGNSEFYSGCSYYYCNVNITANTAAGYAPWSGTPVNEIQEKMKHNFLYETVPYAWATLYPNADLIEGYTEPIIYELDYVTYDAASATTNDTVRYEVVGPAQFKLVYSTWLGGAVTE